MSENTHEDEPLDTTSELTNEDNSNLNENESTFDNEVSENTHIHVHPPPLHNELSLKSDWQQIGEILLSHTLVGFSTTLVLSLFMFRRSRRSFIGFGTGTGFGIGYCHSEINSQINRSFGNRQIIPRPISRNDAFNLFDNYQDWLLGAQNLFNGNNTNTNNNNNERS